MIGFHDGADWEITVNIIVFTSLPLQNIATNEEADVLQVVPDSRGVSVGYDESQQSELKLTMLNHNQYFFSPIKITTKT